MPRPACPDLFGLKVLAEILGDRSCIEPRDILRRRDRDELFHLAGQMLPQQAQELGRSDDAELDVAMLGPRLVEMIAQLLGEQFGFVFRRRDSWRCNVSLLALALAVIASLRIGAQIAVVRAPLGMFELLDFAPRFASVGRLENLASAAVCNENPGRIHRLTLRIVA